MFMNAEDSFFRGSKCWNTIKMQDSSSFLALHDLHPSRKLRNVFLVFFDSSTAIFAMLEGLVTP